MPRLSPFNGLVFDAAVSGPLESVTAPPYDVISDHRRLGYLRASPFSVVHLDLAEGTDDPTDPQSRYARAGRLLRDWEAAGALRRAEEPCYYAYEMSSLPGPRGAGPGSALGPGGTVRGLICAMELEVWGGTVLPHEEVQEGPVGDRLALLRATRTHLSPVYGTLEGTDDWLDASVREVASTPTPFEAVDEQSMRHRMWPVEGTAIQARLEGLRGEQLLIADGHHRYTTALRYRAERRRSDGPGPWDAVLTLVVDSTAEHLAVMPFHRVQLAGEAPTAGEAMPGLAETLGALRDDDLTIGTIALDARNEVGYRVLRLEGGPPTVRALHEELLDDLAPSSLRYVSDAAEADATLRRGEAVAVYLLPPTTPGRIRAVVERGERLPQKSTYFWPKPRTGMVMMPLDPDPASPFPKPVAQSRAADPSVNPTGRAS